MNARILSVVALAGLVGGLPAQFTDRPLLVGWTNSPLLPSSGNIDIQDVEGSCAPAKNLCGGVLLHGNSWTGGTAYDCRHQSVWVSDGRGMEEREIATCNILCKTTPSIMRTGATIGGLAVADARRFLYHLETMPGYLGILPYDNSVCPPRPTKGGCFMQLDTNEVAGGLAYDEARDLLYFTTSKPATIGWDNTLYVAQVTNGCQPVCKVALNPCRRTPDLVTGLAYDSCSKRLYAAQGADTLVCDMVDPLKCAITVVTCCSKQIGSAWGGLAVIPGWRQLTFGTACLPKGGCPYCGNMGARLVGGDPSLGNRDFGIEMGQGPTGQYAMLLLGGGVCTKGWTVPFACGALYPTLTPGILSPPVQLTGSAVCDGAATIPLPLPTDPGFCGVQFCMQWLVICAPQLGLSEALQFHVTGS